MEVEWKVDAAVHGEGWNRIKAISGEVSAMSKDAHTILDLGGGSGWFGMHLASKHPDARVISLDIVPRPGEKKVSHIKGSALEALKIDSRTAVVTLTHDPKLDDPALHVALRSEAFYIGALGSRKTHGRRVERLTEEGYTEGEIGKIHAPVGLAINAKSPAEIAISIMAQVTQVLRTE